MAAQSANVTSVDALRAMKFALEQFDADVRDALVQLQLEVRRPVDWIENDRTQYWPRQARKASDVVSEARIALERCEMSISDENRSCYDERKALEKAKRRLRLCEAKIPVVGRWRVKIRKEVDEFDVQLAKLNQFLDTDFLRSITALRRMTEALDRYVQQGGPSERPADSGPSAMSRAPAAETAGDIETGATE